MKIIPIANQKGGVGKTTVAMQLGAILSRRFSVLVVDVDPQQSTVWWAENARDRLPFDFAGNQSPRMLARLHELRVAYDFVLVDTPGTLIRVAIDLLLAHQDQLQGATEGRTPAVRDFGTPEVRTLRSHDLGD